MSDTKDINLRELQTMLDSDPLDEDFPAEEVVRLLSEAGADPQTIGEEGLEQVLSIVMNQVRLPPPQASNAGQYDPHGTYNVYASKSPAEEVEISVETLRELVKKLLTSKG